jgi:hypothetical protein
MIHESPFTDLEEKSMQSWLDTNIFTFHTPGLAQRAFFFRKKYIKSLNLERLVLIILDVFNWSDRMHWQARPNRSVLLEYNTTFSPGFENGRVVILLSSTA